MYVKADRRGKFISAVGITKTLRIMKITAFLLLVGSLTVAAHGRAQDRVTLHLKGAALETVLEKIQEQTGYSYVFLDEAVHVTKKFDVNVRGASVEEVLDSCLKGLPVGYEITGRMIKILVRSDGKTGDMTSLPKSEVLTTVSGKVTTEAGVPLSGATVILKGTNKAILTDENGNFSLVNVPAGEYTLEISFVGYDAYKERINVIISAIKVSVVLKQATNSLDETQVIAYGTVSKRLNTGNVSSVKAEDIQKQSVNNPLLALEGRVPGMFVQQNSGVPGAGVTVRIQGQNSIANGNDPLYVIDGVPWISQLPITTDAGILGSSGGSANGGGGSGNPLTYLDPYSIESIDVLKDADATAIYGSRAANGAVLITTKRGKKGRPRVDINGQQGAGIVSKRMAMLNLGQYLAMRHEALRNNGTPTPGATDYDLNGLWDTTHFTNWQNSLIGRTAEYTNANASVSGGAGNMQFLVGGTYHRETSVFPGDFADQKGGLNFNLSSLSADQRFNIEISCNYLVDDNRLLSTDLTPFALELAPDAPKIYNTDGTLNWAPNAAGASSWTNPLANSLKTYHNNANNLISNGVIGYQLLPGLELKGSVGYTNLQIDEFLGNPLISYAPEIRSLINATAIYTDNTVRSWIVEPQITYKKKIGGGKLDFLVGTTINQITTNGYEVQGTGYNSDAQLQDIHSAATLLALNSVNNVYKYNALFARLNFNWQDKYLIDLTARRDGSSRFGPTNQFHNFAAAGAAWIFSEEAFFKNHMRGLSFGKLKGSYGTTGNDQLGEYKFLNLYRATTAGVPYQGTAGLVSTGLTNPGLEWEETHKISVGMDLGFVKNRIIAGATYSRNRSSNQLLSYGLPYVTGFTSVMANFPATVQNRSWEFTVTTYNVKSGSFTWTTTVNLTLPQNKLIAFPNLASSSYANTLVVGHPLDVQKVYRFLWVDPATGVYLVADSKGNPTTTPNVTVDNTRLINIDPRLYGGLENSLEFKGFRLDFFFQFDEQTQFNPFYYGSGSLAPGFRDYNMAATVWDRWQKSGDIAHIQKYGTSASNPTYSNMFASSAPYKDASYIRLKNASLSWRLPSKWKGGLTGLRIYVQGQNLLTFTHWKGLDPETPGLTLPPLRVITAGLEVGL